MSEVLAVVMVLSGLLGGPIIAAPRRFFDSLAVAATLAFGLGGRDLAADTLKDWTKGLGKG